MAITRYAGDRFTIAAGDTKPTGVLDGAVLVDTGNLELYVKRNGSWVEIAGGGGGGTPADPTTSVQFNNGGSFGGDADLTFTDGNRLNVNKLGISGIIYDSNNSIGNGGMVLANEGTTGVHWKNIESVLSGVGGSGVANYVARWSDEDTLTTGALVDNGTKVGIGTATPSQFLDILATQESDAGIRVTLNCNLDSQAPQLILNRAAQNGGIVDAGDVLGVIKFGGYDGNSVENNTKIEATVNGTPSNNNMPTDLSFYTASAGSPVRAMTINKDQKVGIGTDAPDTLLDLQAAAGADMLLRRAVGDTSSNLGVISFGNADVDKYLAQIKAVQDGATDSARLEFQTEVAGGDKYTRMTIKSDGNVGIGNTAPAYKLDVAGDIRVGQGQSTGILHSGGDLQFYADSAKVIEMWTSGSDYIFKSFHDIAYFSESNIKFGLGTTAPGGILSIGSSNESYFSSTAANTLNFFYNEDGDTGGWINYRGFEDGITQPRDLIIGDGKGAKIATFDGSTKRVGVGTEAPWSRFTIAGGTTAEADDFIPMSVSPSVTGGNSAGVLFGVYPVWGYAKQGIFWERYVGNSGYGGRGKLHFVNRDAVDTSVPTIADAKMTILEDGNVGIGTTTPSADLEVSTASGGEFLVTRSGNSGVTLQQVNGGDATSGSLSIKAGTAMNLYTNGTGRALTIDSSQNVGIGTDTPGSYDSRAERLVVHESGDGGVTIATGATSDGRLVFARSGDTGLDHGEISYDQNTDYMGFATAGSRRVTLDNSGKVGIGTDAPVSSLHVAGDDTISVGPFGGNGTGYLVGTSSPSYTNQPGTSLILKAGDGSGTGSSYMAFYTSPSGSAGTTVNTSVERIRILNDGTLDLKSAKFKINGSGGTNGYTIVTDGSGNISWSSAGTGTVTGSGTDNYVPRWNGTTALQNSSIIALDSGSVGIGTTDPDSALHVYDIGSGEVRFQRVTGYTGLMRFGFPSGTASIRTDGNFQIKASDAWGADLYIKSDGNVGIGTNAPGSLLRVEGSNATAYAGNAAQDDEGVTLSVWNQDETALGSYAALQLVNKGTGSHGKARIACIAPANNQGALAFTVENAGTFIEAMRILGDGKVGINMAIPGYKLDVYEQAGNEIARFAGANSGSVTLRNDAANVFRIYAGASDSLGFSAGNSYNADHLTIASDGNVGIGTTAPAGKLHVIDSYAGERNIFLDNPNASGVMQLNIRAGTGNEYLSLLRTTTSASLLVATDPFYIKHYHSGAWHNSIVVAADGKIGIGTASPTTSTELYHASTTDPTLLQITNFSAGDAFINFIERDATGNTNGTKFGEANAWGFQVGYDGGDNKFFIKSGNQETVTTRLAIERDTGNVGIGTIAPGLSDEWLPTAETLSVIGSSLAGSVEIGHSEITNNIIFGALKFVNPDNSDASQATNRFVAGLYSRIQTSDNNAGDDSGGSLHFTVKPEASTLLDALTIHSDTKIGMGSVFNGTVTPSSKLSVGGNSTQTLKPTVAIVDTRAILQLRGGAPTIFMDSMSAGIPTILMDGRGIEFKDGTLDSEGNVDVKIAADGKVGIGTTNPGYALDIRTAAGDVFLKSNTGTNRTGFQAANTGGTSYFYRESSSGGNAITGSLAYATVVGGTGAYPLQLGTNNAIRLTIDSAGKVGIGTNNPASQLHMWGANPRIDLTDTDTGCDAYITADSSVGGMSISADYNDEGSGAYLDLKTANASRLMLRSTGLHTFTGKVGIGTVSPGLPLEVKTSGSASNQYALSLTNPNNQAGDGGGAGIRFSTSSGPSGAGNEANKYSSIEAFDVNNWGSNSGLSFTTSLGYTKTKSMVIDRNGKVGIGTNAPNARLEVEDGGTASSVILKVTADDQTPYALMVGNDTYSTTDTDGIGMWINNAGQGKLHARGTGSQLILGAAGTNYVYLLSDGNVGIGTTNPGYKLHVNGSVKIGNNSYLSNTTTSSVSLNSSGDVLLTAIQSGAVFAVKTWNGSTQAERFKISGAGAIATTAITGNATVSGSLKATTILDTNDSAGTNGQVLVSTGAAIDWKTLSEISGVDGSGTAGYLSKWTDSDTIGNSPIYTDGTDVAIGSTAFGVGGTQDLSIGNPGTTTGGITLWSTTSATHSLGFGDANSGTARYEGYVEYSHGDNSMRLATSHAERVRITSDGKVGIGTTAPGTALSVYGTDFNSASVEITRTGTGQDDDGALRFNRVDAVQAGERLGGIYFNESGTARARIRGEKKDTAIGEIGFQVSTASKAITNSSADDMTLTPTGLGIGTTAPSSKLHVNGSGAVHGQYLRISNGTTQKYELQPSIVNVTNNGFGIYDVTDSLYRLVIDTSGNVGIGVVSPPNRLTITAPGNADPLHIYGNGAYGIKFSNNGTNFVSYLRTFESSTQASNYMSFGVSTGNNTTSMEAMRLMGDGNVGIGTTTPSNQLHVYDGAINCYVKVDNGSDNAAGVRFKNPNAEWYVYNTNAAGGGNLRFWENSGSEINFTPAGKVGIGVTTPGGFLSVEGAGNSRGIFVKSAGATTYSAIQAEADALTTGSIARLYSNSATTNTRYLVNIINDNAAATAAVGLRIQQDSTAAALIALGNVGIGTDAPLELLHVQGTNDASDVSIRIKNLGTSNGTRTDLDFHYSTADRIGGRISCYLDDTSTNSTSMHFLTRVNNSSGERMRIDSAGNVGIGTTSPSYKLEVVAATSSDSLLVSAGGNGKWRFTGDGVGFWGAALDYGHFTWDTGRAIFGALSGKALAILAGGAEKVRILTDGNVGIGITNPSTLLEVSGIATAGTFRATGKLVSADNIFMAAGQFYLGAENGSTNDTYRMYHSSGSFLLQSRESGTWTTRFDIGTSGAIKFNAYGSGTHTGTAAYKLSVDSSGNIIETAIGAGAVDGSGTTNYISKWTDSDTLGNSSIHEAGAGSLQIEGPSAGRFLTLNAPTTGGYITFETADTAFADIGTAKAISGNAAYSTTDLMINTRSGAKNVVFGMNGVEKVRIDNTGKVGIGTTSASRLLDVNGTSYFRDDIYFGNTVLNVASGFATQTGMGWDKSTGEVQISSTTSPLQLGRHGSTGPIFVCRYESVVKATLDTSGDLSIAGTLSESSSIAIKENVETYSPSLENISKIRPVRFNKKKSKKKEVGLVAEELAEMFPELVETDEKGNPSGVNYSRAVAVLLHGFKELYKEVKELKEKI